MKDVKEIIKGINRRLLIFSAMVAILALCCSCAKTTMVDKLQEQSQIIQGMQQTEVVLPKLKGVFSEAPKIIGIDDDDDGLHEYLKVDLLVSAETEGTYYFNVFLMEKDGTLIDIASMSLMEASINFNYAYLSKGENVVTFYFDGEKISDSGVDGPYLVKAFVKDYSGFSVDGTWETDKFLASDFRGTLFNDVVISHVAVDEDSDGLWDSLDVTVNFQVIEKATFEINGSLWGVDLIDNQTVSKKLKKGRHSIKISFPGEAIRYSEIDSELSLILYIDDGLYAKEFTYQIYDLKSIDFKMSDVRFIEGSIKDFPTDINEHGLYEKLAITGEAVSVKKGQFVIMGRLVDNNGDYIETVEKSIFLNETPVKWELKFETKNISNLGSSGPYKVELLILDGKGNEVFGQVYKTNTYDLTRFAGDKVRFTNDFTDTGIDNNSDGFYEAIQVGIGLEVIESGKYTLDISVYNEDYIFLTYVTKDIYLEKGKQTVYVDIDGTELFECGIDGPYIISSVTLKDGKGQYVAFVAIDDRYKTKGYSYKDFTPGNVIKASLVKVDCKDKDKDGKYESLDITVKLNVSETGYYSYFLSLMDMEGYEITWVSGGDTLEAFTGELVLSFKGSDIASSKKNGPYILSGFQIYRFDNEEFMVLDEIKTKDFKWNQFE